MDGWMDGGGRERGRWGEEMEGVGRRRGREERVGRGGGGKGIGREERVGGGGGREKDSGGWKEEIGRGREG